MNEDDKYIPMENLLEKVKAHKDENILCETKAVVMILEQNNLMREGLKFYANPISWFFADDKEETTGRLLITKIVYTDASVSGGRFCGGKLARDTLKKVGGK